MTPTQDPLAIYRLGKQGTPSTFQAPDPFEEEEEEDPLAKYRTKPPEKENAITSFAKDIPRKQYGIAARVGETILGAPEDIRKGFGTLLDMTLGNASEYLTGKKQPELREFLKNPPVYGALSGKLPTSEDVKENVTKPLSKAITGDENILEPKSEPEKFVQEATKTLTQLSLPGGGASTWAQRTALAFAGETAKEATKYLGFDPSKQEIAKLATLGITSLAQIGNAPQFARQYFQQQRNAIPRGVRFNAQPMQQRLNQIRNSEWFRVGDPASTRAARALVDDVEGLVNNGTVGARDAMRMREVINEAAENLGAFAVDRRHRGAHAGHVNEVRDALIHGMEQTLGHQYPNWWGEYQNANAVFGITRRSSALGDFIASNYAKPLVSEAGKVLFGNAIAKGGAGVAKLALATGAIATGAKAIELTNRIMRSPTLRRYYQDVVAQAGRQDAAAMSKALSKFDEESAKEEKSTKARRVLSRPSQK